jgi:hypothetical protein
VRVTLKTRRSGAGIALSLFQEDGQAESLLSLGRHSTLRTVPTLQLARDEGRTTLFVLRNVSYTAAGFSATIFSPAMNLVLTCPDAEDGVVLGGALQDATSDPARFFFAIPRTLLSMQRRQAGAVLWNGLLFYKTPLNNLTRSGGNAVSVCRSNANGMPMCNYGNPSNWHDECYQVSAATE